MAYSELSEEELILLSAEFIGRGQKIPRQIKSILGPDLIEDIENPERTHEHEECECPRDQRGRHQETVPVRKASKTKRSKYIVRRRVRTVQVGPFGKAGR